MIALNFPTYSFDIVEQDGKSFIFDENRKKHMVLTPEEWVRQHVVKYLTLEKKYPLSRIAIEKELRYNGNKKRFDILLYDKALKPYLLVECKAPSIKITQDVFNQIATYNTIFKVEYLLITNGLTHYCCEFNEGETLYNFIKEIPSYKEI